MRKKITYLLIIPLVIVFVSCTGSRNGIYQTKSFYKINTPGTIAVDDNGNEIKQRRDTVREIYIITKSMNPPVIDAVFINNHYYSSVISKIDSNKIYVGERLPDNRRIELKAGNNQFIWKILIGQLLKDQIPDKSGSELQFYLAIRFKDKGKLHAIKSSIELVPELHY